jgi:hypothetical protein
VEEWLQTQIETPERLKAARACQRVIGRELRLMYDEIVGEQVPNELLELLHRIDAAPSGKIASDAKLTP